MTVKLPFWNSWKKVVLWYGWIVSFVLLDGCSVQSSLSWWQYLDNLIFTAHSWPYTQLHHRRLSFSTYQWQLIQAGCSSWHISPKECERSRPLYSFSQRNPSASVPPHLLTLVHRWGDNCKGTIVKEIIGDSIPPDRSWSGLGFWPTAQVSVYPYWKHGVKQRGGETMA